LILCRYEWVKDVQLQVEDTPVTFARLGRPRGRSTTLPGSTSRVKARRVHFSDVSDPSKDGSGYSEEFNKVGVSLYEEVLRCIPLPGAQVRSDSLITLYGQYALRVDKADFDMPVPRMDYIRIGSCVSVKGADGTTWFGRIILLARASSPSQETIDFAYVQWYELSLEAQETETHLARLVLPTARREAHGMRYSAIEVEHIIKLEHVVPIFDAGLDTVSSDSFWLNRHCWITPHELHLIAEDYYNA
jgi:hypothetical protein